MVSRGQDAVVLLHDILEGCERCGGEGHGFLHMLGPVRGWPPDRAERVSCQSGRLGRRVIRFEGGDEIGLLVGLGHHVVLVLA